MEQYIRNNYANLAYTRLDDYDLDAFKDCISIDLCNSSIQSCVIDSFPNLKRIRCQRCENLQCFDVANCPNLEVIDVSYTSVNGDTFNIQNLPKLKCLDISFTNINSFSAIVPSLEVLLMKDLLFVPPAENLPNLMDLEIGRFCVSQQGEIFSFQKLNRVFLIYDDDEEIDLNGFASMPSLEYLNIYHGFVDMSKYTAPRTSLKYVELYETSIKTGSAEPNFPFFLFNNRYNKFPPILDRPPKWLNSYRLIYGPWGIPPCDMCYDGITVSSEKPPFDVTPDVLDSIIGAVIGAGVGDMLGMQSEFHKSYILHFELLCPLDISWSHMLRYNENGSFMLGTSTDDTDQAVFIMRSLETGKPDLLKFAMLMKQWVRSGIVEHFHGGCYDCGSSTYATVSHPLFLKDPIRASHAVLQDYMAGNGSTMRTSPVGCFKFWDEETVKNNAKMFGEATHAHNKATASCVCVSLLIARFIQKRAGLIKDFSIEDTLQESLKFAGAPDDELLHQTSLKGLSLDYKRTGYAYRALGCTLVALRRNWTYTQAMSYVIPSGGDADTNAAIIGSVLGAKFGFHTIPKEIVKYLYSGNWIYRELQKVIAAMGIEPPESPFYTLSYEE